MLTTLFFILALGAQDAGDPPPEEVDPTEAGEAEARARREAERRSFGGPGATGVQVLGGGAIITPPREEELYQPPQVRPYEMPESAAQDLGADAQDQRFQVGVESARLAAEARLGPLDGAWVLTDADGKPLYDLILTDPAPSGLVEGAWRAHAAPDGPAGSGVMADARRDGDAVLLFFYPPGATEPSTLTIRPDEGGWRAELVGPDGAAREVRLVPA